MSDAGHASPRGERALVMVAVACAFGLLLALAWPMLSGRIYVGADLGNFHLPFRFFYQHALRTGTEFLWYPYEFAGFYLLGEGQTGLYHPLNLLFYRWLPFTLAYDLEILRSYVFGLLGAFLFFRRYALPRSASAFGAILFAFSGFQLLHYMHLNIVAATAHLPWLLLALDVLVRGGSRLAEALAGPGYALLTASQLLLGHPQAIWMSSLVEGLYGLLLWRGGASARAFVRPLLAKLLGVLAGAIQILPLWEALHDSLRSIASRSFVTSFSLVPLHLAQLLQPYLLSDRVLRPSPIERGLYLGAVGVLALAWLVAAKAEPGPARRLGRGALALAALGLMLALGPSGGLSWLVTRVPVVGQFRAPARYLWLVQVASAVAGALIFADLQRRTRRGASRAERAIAQGAVLLSALLAAVLLVAIPEEARGARFAAIGVALVGGAAWLLLLARRGSTAALAALLVFACTDIGAYGVTAIRRRSPPPISLADFQRSQPVPPGAPQYRVLWGPMAASMLGVRYLWGYVALWPARRIPVLPVDFLGHPIPPEFEAAREAGLRVASVYVAGAEPPLPRVRMLTHAEVSSKPIADIARIDVATTALLPEAVALDAGPPGEAEIRSETPGELRIETRAAGRQVLAISESFHEGWRAWIDGTPAPLLRAYGDYMGLVVPAGAHRVRLHFEPMSFFLGARISAAALLAIGAWLVAGLVRLRRRAQPREDVRVG